MDWKKYTTIIILLFFISMTMIVFNFSKQGYFIFDWCKIFCPTTTTTIHPTTTIPESGPIPVSIPPHMSWILKRVYQHDVHDDKVYRKNIPILYSTWDEPGTSEKWEGIAFLSNEWGDVVYKLNHLKSGGPEQWTLEVSIIGWHQNDIYYIDHYGKENLIFSKPATPDFNVTMQSYISIRVYE